MFIADMNNTNQIANHSDSSSSDDALYNPPTWQNKRRRSFHHDETEGRLTRRLQTLKSENRRLQTKLEALSTEVRLMRIICELYVYIDTLRYRNVDANQYNNQHNNQ